jgi:hypothetical protein
MFPNIYLRKKKTHKKRVRILRQRMRLDNLFLFQLIGHFC